MTVFTKIPFKAGVHNSVLGGPNNKLTPIECSRGSKSKIIFKLILKEKPRDPDLDFSVFKL
jgi:hypothetical protein